MEQLKNEKTESNSLWEIVLRKQADFSYTKNLNPDDLFEIRINSGQVTEKAVTVTLKALVDMIEDVRVR